MRSQGLCILALAGFSAATTSCQTGTTSCVDFIEECGTPPTAVLTYGGCYDQCDPTTYTAPPCPTPTTTTPITLITTTACTSTGTICEDHLKTCGSPTPTATLTYGGCHDACQHVTYTPPPCPIPTVTSSCTSTGTICEDHFVTCGTPTPTATLTYGGCHAACDQITYSAPSCPTPTSTLS
ncbi:hypothetical protein GGR57DRAFT_304917 [Xylariaceae sp. FL1272]|nr:hypothetical protein GGR57DRAFT_304917 [Xylariaceae sp. FL1272]